MYRKLKSLSNYFGNKVDINKETLTSLAKSTMPKEKLTSISKVVSKNLNMCSSGESMNKSGSKVLDYKSVNEIIEADQDNLVSEYNSEYSRKINFDLSQPKFKTIQDYPNLKYLAKNVYDNIKIYPSPKDPEDDSETQLSKKRSTEIKKAKSSLMEYFTLPLFSLFYRLAKSRDMNKEFPNTMSHIDENGMLPNELKNRVSVIQYDANCPREDRHNAIQLKNFDGYILSVLDGHGGHDIADVASKKIHILFDEIYRKTKEDDELSENEKIIASINGAFEHIVQMKFNLGKRML